MKKFNKNTTYVFVNNYYDTLYVANDKKVYWFDNYAKRFYLSYRTLAELNKGKSTHFTLLQTWK